MHWNDHDAVEQDPQRTSGAWLREQTMFSPSHRLAKLVP